MKVPAPDNLYVKYTSTYKYSIYIARSRYSWREPASEGASTATAHAGNRKHSRNHSRTNLNPRFLVAALPIGAALGLAVMAYERRQQQ